MPDIASYPLPLVFLCSIVAILAACEFGRWLGVRASVSGGSNVGTLEAAILGLLALLISFSFAMALSRFDARRDSVLNEATAIGTTALRARMLPPPHNVESLALLREYVRLRLHMAQPETSSAEFSAGIARSNAIHELLWQQATQAAANNDAMVPTGLLIQALNEMIDQQEKRLTAVRNRVPGIVFLALYGIAIVAAAFTGYANGGGTRNGRLPAYVLGITIAAVILLIQDLDSPRAGLILVDQQPMIDTAATLAEKE